MFGFTIAQPGDLVTLVNAHNGHSVWTTEVKGQLIRVASPRAGEPVACEVRVTGKACQFATGERVWVGPGQVRPRGARRETWGDSVYWRPWALLTGGTGAPELHPCQLVTYRGGWYRALSSGLTHVTLWHPERTPQSFSVPYGEVRPVTLDDYARTIRAERPGSHTWCDGCGQKVFTLMTTQVSDWREGDRLCPRCVANHEWPDDVWSYAPERGYVRR